MTAAAPAKPTCDAPVRDGRCGKVAWRAYQSLDGTDRAFCVLSEHAWRTTERYPALLGTERRVGGL